MNQVGPRPSAPETTRHSIRTFFIWAKKSKVNVAVQIGFRQAKTTPTITQEQRRAWLKELLSGSAESLPYRVAGDLLLHSLWESSTQQGFHAHQIFFSGFQSVSSDGAAMHTAAAAARRAGRHPLPQDEPGAHQPCPIPQSERAVRRA